MITRSRLKRTEEGSGNYDKCSSNPRSKKKRKIADRMDISDAKGALLKLIVDMPVDVLLEVFKHLKLVDLMHLSRTLTVLRSILMSRSSISVWKQVVANDGLPPCTKDLNEPQLAELMFGRSCDWCQSEQNVSCHRIIWDARVRRCSHCVALTFKSINLDHRGYPVELAILLPSFDIGQQTYIDRVLDQDWRREYAAQRSKAKKLKWLEERVAERTVISEHAAACQEWFKLHLKALVARRKAVIIDRLQKRGWKEELDKLRLRERPTNKLEDVVKACQSDLTEPTASFTILVALDSALDSFMEDIKTSRLVREKQLFFYKKLKRLRKISREYKNTLPVDHMFPNTADIYFHPTVHSALSAVESNDALGEALSRIQLSLPEIVDDCLRLSKLQLANLVIEDYTIRNNKSFDPSVLTFSSTLFHCSGCQSDLTLDQTVAHRCRPSGIRLSVDQQDVYNAIHEVTTESKIRSIISFSLARLQPLVSVLHSCGIDSKTTTADMNGFGPIIERLDFFTIKHSRLTKRWLTVMKHFRQPFSHHTNNVSLLDEPEAEIVRAQLLEEHQKYTANSKDHICIHCRKTGGSSLIKHVKRECHHIDSPCYGQDIIVSPRARPFHKKFRLWPPKA